MTQQSPHAALSQALPTVALHISSSVAAVVKALKDIDDGREVLTDILSTEEVSAFCKVAGLRTSWAGKAFEDITEVSAEGPRVVPLADSRRILALLKREIDRGTFSPKYARSAPRVPFDRAILDDFLPPPQGGGHVWEFQYALGVELEHGRTRGTNVTNNHPLLTGMIVMAHLTEDRLYYARLWVMEMEGEHLNAQLAGDPLEELEQQLGRARAYLDSRVTEKLATAAAGR